jgi:transcriptional regulator with XRE-family HTH domain
MYFEIGAKIYELRVMNRTSAKSLADKIGVTTQQMYKYEKGVNRIPIPRLLIIAQIFNKPLEHFIITSNNQYNVHNVLPPLEEILITDSGESLLFSITNPAARIGIKK